MSEPTTNDPRISLALSFGLEPADDSPLVRVEPPVKRGAQPLRRTDFQRLDALRQEFVERFGAEDEGRIRLSLSGPNGEAALSHLERICTEFGLRVYGDVEEVWDGPAEWYALRPTAWHVVEPDEALPGCHVMSDLSPVASEEFLRIVQRAGLRGLGHLWWEDNARFRAQRWFRVWPWSPMGRGVDHPWLDGAKVSAASELSGVFRRGVWSFNTSSLRPEASRSEPLRRLLPLRKTDSLRVYGLQRFLRRGVPDADFAYCWISTDTYGGIERNADGGRSRQLFISRHAREVLTDAGVLGRDEAEPVVILDALPLGCEDLDAHPDPLPKPSYTKEELAVHAAATEPKFAAWRQRARLERFTRTEQALELLERHREELGWEPRGVSDAAFTTAERLMGLRLPRSWKTLYPLLPEDVEAVAGDDCYIQAIEGLPHDHAEYNRGLRGQTPAALVNFASTACGDWFSFLTDSPAMPEDCPVVKWDHETGRICRRWECVAAFVQEMVVDTLRERSRDR